jgi:hypothetical protein
VRARRDADSDDNEVNDERRTTMTESIWSPPPDPAMRAQGSRSGAVAWFFGGAATTVLVSALAIAGAESFGSLGLLLLAGGFLGGVCVATQLPVRHGIAYVSGGVATFATGLAIVVHQLFSQPWSF